MFDLFTPLFVFNVILFLLWLLYLGKLLFVKTQEIFRYRLFVVSSSICLIIFVGLFILYFANCFQIIILKPPIVFVFGVFFFSIVSVLYTVSFVARGIVKIENSKSLSLLNYINEIMLLCFFPIGVWFLQKRIVNIFQDTSKF